MRSLIGLAIKTYRRTPLYPEWGARFARVLQWVQSRRSSNEARYDNGQFKMDLDLSHLIDAQLYYANDFEPDAVRTIRQLVKPGDTVVDIGANVGFLTLTLAAQVGTPGRVVAFEPTSWATQRLVTNVELNGFEHVTTEQAAVGAEECRDVAMEIQSYYKLDQSAPPARERVSVVTIDGYFESHDIDRLDFVKIDTDGAESDVLRGAARTLRRYRPALLCEISPFLAEHGSSSGELLELLGVLGYGLYREGSLKPYGSEAAVLAEMPATRGMNVVALAAEA